MGPCLVQRFVSETTPTMLNPSMGWRVVLEIVELMAEGMKALKPRPSIAGKLNKWVQRRRGSSVLDLDLQRGGIHHGHETVALEVRFRLKPRCKTGVKKNLISQALVIEAKSLNAP